MLSADEIDVIAKPMVDLYDEYMNTVINDIARRLVKMGKPTATAAWQMQRLIESGKVHENAIKELAKITGKSEEILTRTFEQAGVRAIRFDDSIYRRAGLNPKPLNLSPAMLAALQAGLKKTGGMVSNLTMTTANAAQTAFIKAADVAYLQVTSGAFSYDDAIKNAIRDVAKEGIKTVHYPTGHVDKLDVAMRRAVVTGVSQTSGVLQLTRAEEMGADLVQVSAHIGARPEHQLFQGRIFSRSGTDKRYPDFIESTGYGTGPGLMGWNCRHSFYPYFKGISEEIYSKAITDEYDRKTVTYNGRKMSVYDATQEQRYIERKIRYWKRMDSAYESAGLPHGPESSKVAQWQARMRDFTKQTGLNRQRWREQTHEIIKNGPPKPPAPPPVPPAPPPAPPPVAKPPKPKPTPPPPPAPKPAVVQPAAASPKWKPASSIAAIEKRLEKFYDGQVWSEYKRRKGYVEFKGANLKGIALEKANKILKAFEDVAGKYNLKITYFGNQIKPQKSLGFYSFYSEVRHMDKPRSLQLNKAYIKEFETRQIKAIEYSKRKIEKNLKYYADAIADPARFRLVADNKKRLSIWQTIKYWTVDMADGADPIEALIRHEAYHGVYFQHRLRDTFANALKKFNVRREDWYAVSEYAGKNVEELFAELATAVDMGIDVPENMKKAMVETLATVEGKIPQ